MAIEGEVPAYRPPDLVIPDLQSLSGDAQELYAHILDADPDPLANDGVNLRYAICLYRSKWPRRSAPKTNALRPAAELLAAGLVVMDRQPKVTILRVTGDNDTATSST